MQYVEWLVREGLWVSKPGLASALEAHGLTLPTTPSGRFSQMTADGAIGDKLVLR